MTPAAPLEKAVEESREALAAYERCSDPECSVCVSALEVATRALLAALDADPWWSVWQKTYHSQREAEDRLEEAEAALHEVYSSSHGPAASIVSRYFTEKGKR